MIFNVHMLGALTFDAILTHGYGRLVVSIHNAACLCVQAQLLHQAAQPQHLLDSCSLCVQLSLTCGQRDHTLLLAAPAHGITVELGHPSADGSSVSFVVGPVCISEGTHIHMHARLHAA